MSLMDQLFDTLSRTIHTNLDIRLQRQNLITGNIVNTDTPNYVPVDMDFQGTLEAVSQGEVGFSVPRAATYYDATQAPGPDGNAVDIDYEMTRMALNQGAYQSSSVTLNKRLSLLRYAIMEGRSG